MNTLSKVAFGSLVVLSSSALADNQSPSVVDGVRAQSVSDSAVKVEWSAAQDNVGIDGYNIYRNGAYFDTIIGNATNYTDTQISSGSDYRYAIVAFDRARNYSRLSSQVSTSTDSGRSIDADSQPAASGTPATPTGLTASRSSSGSSAVISWDAPPGGANSYNVYKDGNYFTTVHGTTTFTDNSLNSNRNYYFQVVAIRGNQFSTLSPRATALSGSAPSDDTPVVSDGSTPATPTNVQYEVLSGSSVKLTWNAPAGGADGYNVNMNSGYLTTVAGGRTSVIVDGLSINRNYWVSVAAFRSGKFSVNSPDLPISTGGARLSPPPVENPGSNGSAPDGYAMVFNEDFNSWDFDVSKWNTNYRWGADWIINNEEQYYADILNDRDFGVNPFKFSGDNLTIEATRTPDWLRGDVRNQDYISGAITTHNKFNMKYGFVEMRARVPQGKGLWPAFWLLHSGEDKQRPEIDVMELLGDNPRLVYQTYHYYENDILKSTPSFQAPGPDYSAGFHTYAMLWEPGKITWYIDGVETNKFESDKVPDEDMYLLLNLALGGSWAGIPDNSTPFPAQYQIDYVRAYQKR